MHRHQIGFMQDKTFERGFVAGRGGGKTVVGSLDVVRNSKDGDECMAVSPSYVMVEDTTLPTFVEVCEMLGILIKKIKTPFPRVWFATRDGGVANCVFRTGEKPDKLRGPSKSRLWLDEASIMHPDVIKWGIAVLRHKGRMGKLTMTFTPRGRSHWTFERFYHRLGPLDEFEGGIPKGAVVVQGTVYQPKKRTKLHHCHSSENPFLPPEFVELIQTSYSAQLRLQELGGEFVDLEGLLFNREWFPLTEATPREGLFVRYWDRAIDTTGTGSQTAGALLCRTPDDFYWIVDVVNGHWGAYERDTIIEQTAHADRDRYGDVLIYVEQEGGSAGPEVAQQLVKRLAGFPVYVDKVSGGKAFRKQDGVRLPGEAKVVRAGPLSSAAENGLLRMCKGRWNADCLDQLAAFPEATMADIVDACSGAYNKLANRGGFETPLAGSMGHTPAEQTAGRFGALLKSLRGGADRIEERVYNPIGPLRQ